MKREEEEKNLEKENANLRDQINVRKRQIHDDIRIIEQLEKKIKMAEDEIEEMKRSFNIQFGGKDQKAGISLVASRARGCVRFHEKLFRWAWKS